MLHGAKSLLLDTNKAKYTVWAELRIF